MSAPAAVVLVVLGCLVLIAYTLAAVTVVPVAVYCLLAGLLAGVVLGLAEATRVLGGLVDTPRVRTPHDEFGARPAGPLRSHRRDYAWPHYAVRQAGYDLRHVVERCYARVTGWWRAGWRVLPRLPRYHVRVRGASDDVAETETSPSRAWTVALGWPLLAVPGAALVGVTVGTVAVLVLLAVVVALVTATSWLLGVVAAGALRAADRRWRAAWRTDTCCPRCYFLIELPVYACPGDHADMAPAPLGSWRHRLLRPDSQGLWRRRCGCGVSLPARQSSAGARLSARCPKCDSPLADGTGRATEIRVAVFGAPDAGKTTLVDTVVQRLAARFPPDRCAVDRPAPGGRGRTRVVGVALRAQRAPQRVQVFDAPGRGLVDREVCASYGFLDEARNFVFVLDPLSLPALRRRVAEAPAHLVPAVRVARHDVADSYEAVVVGLRHRGVATERCRLAFVVSKADLIGLLPGVVAPADDSAAVRRWLAGHGLDHLLTAVGRDFAEVRFFLHGRADPPPSDPLLWLLRGERVLRREVAGALR
ncbi:hypothetical protein ACGFIG_27255 [Micromonospora sp. NPDC049048]|uniref:hypothetical protein n=1 Tax=Micromonospora sp. NPDC049048 TaxID=3364263 RepID=UPI00371912FF